MTHLPLTRRRVLLLSFSPLICRKLLFRQLAQVLRHPLTIPMHGPLVLGQRDAVSTHMRADGAGERLAALLAVNGLLLFVRRLSVPFLPLGHLSDSDYTTTSKETERHTSSS